MPQNANIFNVICVIFRGILQNLFSLKLEIWTNRLVWSILIKNFGLGQTHTHTHSHWSKFPTVTDLFIEGSRKSVFQILSTSTAMIPTKL